MFLSYTCTHMEGRGCSNNKLIKIKNFFLKETQKKKREREGESKGKLKKMKGGGATEENEDERDDKPGRPN